VALLNTYKEKTRWIQGVPIKHLSKKVTVNAEASFLTTLVGPQGWTWPPGVNLAPRGELGQQGWTWSPGVNLVL
jgi:hypothetical protein